MTPNDRADFLRGALRGGADFIRKGLPYSVETWLGFTDEAADLIERQAAQLAAIRDRIHEYVLCFGDPRALGHPAEKALLDIAGILDGKNDPT
jgi:hypothetical protein